MCQVLRLTTIFLRCVPALFRSRNNQAIVELALRQQLATYALKGPKPRITSVDRTFWVFQSRIWSKWKENLVVQITLTTYRLESPVAIHRLEFDGVALVLDGLTWEVVPEPSTALLMGLGLTALGWRGRVRQSWR